MLFVIGLAVLATAFAADLPIPKAKHLKDGALEISLEDVAGVIYKDIKYVHGGKKHMGPFFQSADGKWYHRNSKANKHSPGKPIKYQLLAEMKGKPVTVSGTVDLETTGVAISPPRQVRRGTVVFRDDFSTAFNPNDWDVEVSMYGGYNWEIQVYTNDKQNVFTKNGNLYLQPTITNQDPRFGGNFLTTGIMDMTTLFGVCTESGRFGCHREGQYGLLPPVMSGKVKSKKTIRYGSVEVRAKIPRGEWLWPAIWMLPKASHYGGWPRSGEIDLMESRGNEHIYDGAGHDHGVRQVSSTLHWGTDAGQNRFTMTHGDKSSSQRWSDDFHTYKLDWTVDHIIISVDGHVILNRPTPNEGYFQWGNLPGNNIWSNGQKSAPFDQAFYLILNVAVGGTNGFFPDSWNYSPHSKPWNDNSATENADFWSKRSQWMPTWSGDAAAMTVDYVQMTQL